MDTTTARDGDRVARLEEELDASRQFLGEAIRSRRFSDATRYQIRIREFRQGLSELHPLTVDEKLELSLQQAAILTECEELHEGLLPRDLDELEQSAERLDPRLWGQLCASMGSLYMRWTSFRDLDKAKNYLQLALNSLTSVDPSDTNLRAISQDLADVYNLKGDLSGADKYFRGREDVDRRRIDRVNSWCKARGLEVSRFDHIDAQIGKSALQLAVQHQESEILAVMLSFTQRTRPKDALLALASDLLLGAAEAQNEEAAQALIVAGARIDALDQRGRSGLHRCQASRRQDKSHGLGLARLFLGGQPLLVNREDKEGTTALSMACEAGDTSMAELLLEHGGDPAKLDMYGKTCLHTACERGDLDMVRVLLAATATLDINARGPGGCTPIILAVQAASANRRKVNIVKELMRHHADPGIRDHRGNDAFRYVAGLAGQDIEQALRQPGGVPSARSKSVSLDVPIARRHSADVRSKVMGFLNIGQGSKTSLSSRATSNDQSSASASIFSRSNASTRSTAYSALTRETPAAPSLLEEKGDTASHHSHESHPPENPDDPAPRLVKLEEEDEPEDESGDFPTPTTSDVASEELVFRPAPPGTGSPAIRQHASSTPRASGQQASPSALGKTQGSSGASGGTSGRVNRSSGASGPSGRRGLGPIRAVPAAASDDGAPPDKYFACPFAKHNVFKHRDCTSYCGKRIRDVKQHVRRAHYHPYYCARCYQVFGTVRERDDHTRVMACDYHPPGQDKLQDSITDEQNERLGRQCPSHMNNDHPAQWFYMFDIIFPNQPKPNSPYVDFDPFVMFNTLRTFTQNHVASHVARHASSGSLPCWDANHLSAVMQIVNGLVDSFVDSLQEQQQGPNGDAPTALNTNPHTPESLVTSGDLASDRYFPVENDFAADVGEYPGTLMQHLQPGNDPSFSDLANHNNHWDFPSPVSAGGSTPGLSAGREQGPFCGPLPPEDPCYHSQGSPHSMQAFDMSNMPFTTFLPSNTTTNSPCTCRTVGNLPQQQQQQHQQQQGSPVPGMLFFHTAAAGGSGVGAASPANSNCLHHPPAQLPAQQQQHHHHPPTQYRGMGAGTLTHEQQHQLLLMMQQQQQQQQQR